MSCCFDTFRQQGYHKSKWELDTSEEHLGELLRLVSAASDDCQVLTVMFDVSSIVSLCFLHVTETASTEVGVLFVMEMCWVLMTVSVWVSRQSDFLLNS